MRVRTACPAGGVQVVVAAVLSDHMLTTQAPATSTSTVGVVWSARLTVSAATETSAGAIGAVSR